MTSSWPFTGRTGLLERLGAWYLDRDVGGVVLTGPAGVGKTRLAEEVLRLATAAGRPTARAIGHPATRPIPLGALAHLLPAELGTDLGAGHDERAALFHAARSGLVTLAAHDRLLFVVDDADQLDDTSLALLLPLTVDRLLFLVATVRTGQPMPAALGSLLKDGHVERTELAPLDREAVSSLLHLVLDGPLDAGGLERLSTVSGGNLQVLSELVRGARDRGSLVRTGNVWRLTDLPTTSGLDELVASHLDGVADGARRILELLAVAGQLGLGDVDSAGGDPAMLETLEADGLISVTTRGRRTELALAHPLYGEVLRSRLPVLRQRALQRQLADRLEAHGARRREDLTRLALWRLEGGGEVDAEVLLRAARLAMVGRDGALAIRFARAAADRGAAGDAARVLVEVYAMGGRTDDLEAAVAAVWDRDDLTDPQRAHLARRIAETRLVARRDVVGALSANEDALLRVASPVDQASLVAHRASLLATAGLPRDAIEIARRLPPVQDPRVRVELGVAMANSLLALGRCNEAVTAARRAQAAQSELPAWLARRGMAQHVVTEAHALAYCGHYRQARALVEPAAERALLAGAAAASVWFEVVLGEIERDCGRGKQAVQHFAAAAQAAERVGQGAAMVWATVGIAQGYLLLGDGDAGEAALRDADAVGDSPVGTSPSTRERCRAWLEACRGDLAAARQRLAGLADEMATTGIHIFEIALRHDVVRFGDAAAALDRLEELESMVDGPLVVAMAQHARGIVRHDADQLAASAEAFETMGSLALAAETNADLADELKRRGDQRAAAAAGQRVARLVELTGVHTPPLQRGAGVAPLTGREREVALLAARGVASKEIAARLYLSTRTVDTHLARVYRKLGVAGREELGAALADGGSST